MTDKVKYHKQKNLAKNIPIPTTLLEVYQKIGQDPQLLLKNYAQDFVLAKIQKYQAESRKFQSLYKISLPKFKKKVEQMKEQENFQWEEDLMDWEFANENLGYWTEVLDSLKRA